MAPAAAIAKSILLEARRGGLPWLAAAAILAAIALAAFLSEVAVTESLALQAAIVAAVLRASAVFLIAAQVASSTLRELNDKQLEQMLALAFPRPVHYLARLAGFAACALALGLAFALPLFAWAPPGTVALWALSLALEAALVAAIALFFSMTLTQLVPAIATTVALYLLARSMAAIQAIASGPLADATLPARIARRTLDAIAFLLPRLDAVTRTEWLLYGAPAPGAYAAALGGLVLYAVLVVAAGLFDFQRRSF